MTPERFTQRMRAISRNDRNANEQADLLMAEALEGAGFGEGVEAWRALRLESISRRELDEAVRDAERRGEERTDKLYDKLYRHFSAIRDAVDCAEAAL